uniref:Interleukin-1 n=1 Tax=Anolis carolinensis TaxID=28377 RepID=A0A803T6M1_ANOCA
MLNPSCSNYTIYCSRGHQLNSLAPCFSSKAHSSKISQRSPCLFRYSQEYNNFSINILSFLFCARPAKKKCFLSLSDIPGPISLSELLMEVFPNTVLDPEMMPIFMGPQGSKQCLSCEKSPEGQIQLQLKVSDIKTLYDKKEESLAFTLYSKTDGSPETCSFESAEFPGWFLSTSSESNKPVGLSRQGGTENTLFYFKRH